MPESRTTYQMEGGRLLNIYSGIVLLSILVAFLTKNYFVLGLPLVVLGTYAIVMDYRWLYLCFWAVLPFSIEYYVGSIGTDLPTEPMMILLTGIGIAIGISKIKNANLNFLFHPVSVFLILHLFWLFFTTLFSQTPVISIKFFLAKIWYVIPFYFMTFHFVKDRTSVLKIWRILSVALSFAIIYTLIRHAWAGFTFKASHKAPNPIFRNHVNYATMIAAVLPLLCGVLITDTKKKFFSWVMVALFLLGIIFSFTRAAQLTVFIMIGAYFAVRWRMIKIFILMSVIGAILGGAYLVHNNAFMQYAPDFDRTVEQTKFDKLIEATYKMEDVSTMERVYRWVAAGYMIADKPITGFGPGGFYSNYKKYTVYNFRTWVSDNPEKSGIHSYYLMTTVEQGVIGLVIFLLFCFSVLIRGQRAYHHAHPSDRPVIMASILSFLAICCVNIINDLIEVDKLGPLFFMNAAIIVWYDIRIHKNHSAIG